MKSLSKTIPTPFNQVHSRIIVLLILFCIAPLSAFSDEPPELVLPGQLPSSMQNMATGGALFFYNAMDYAWDTNFIRTLSENTIAGNFYNFTNSHPSFAVAGIISPIEKLRIGMVFSRQFNSLVGSNANDGEGAYRYTVTDTPLDTNNDGIFDRNQSTSTESYSTTSSGFSILGSLTGHYEINKKLGLGFSYRLLTAQSSIQAAFDVASNYSYTSTGSSSISDKYGPFSDLNSFDLIDVQVFDKNGKLDISYWKHIFEVGSNLNLGAVNPNFYLNVGILRQSGMTNLLDGNGNPTLNIFNGSARDEHYIESGTGSVSNPLTQEDSLTSQAGLKGFSIGAASWVDFKTVELFGYDLTPMVEAGFTFERATGDKISQEFSHSSTIREDVGTGIAQTMLSADYQDQLSDFTDMSWDLVIHPRALLSLSELISFGIGVQYGLSRDSQTYARSERQTDTRHYFDGDANDADGAGDPTATSDTDDYSEIISSSMNQYMVSFESYTHTIGVPMGFEITPKKWLALRAGISIYKTIVSANTTITWTRMDETDTQITYGDASSTTERDITEHPDRMFSDTFDHTGILLNLGMGFMAMEKMAIDFLFQYNAKSVSIQLGNTIEPAFFIGTGARLVF